MPLDCVKQNTTCRQGTDGYALLIEKDTICIHNKEYKGQNRPGKAIVVPVRSSREAEKSGNKGYDQLQYRPDKRLSLECRVTTPVGYWRAESGERAMYFWSKDNLPSIYRMLTTNGPDRL